MTIVLNEETSEVITQGLRSVLCEFLWDVCLKHKNISFQEVCNKYLPNDNLKQIQNMNDLYQYSIKELQMLLASNGCPHLSGAKYTLIQRLWKIIHPYTRDIQKSVPIPWNKEEHKPNEWSSVWAVRDKDEGKCVSASTPNASLYKIDNSQSPPIVLFETSKNYIIEGIMDDNNMIRFGKYPKNITKRYIDSQNDK
tara:strand:- start:1417 stop:2004 length:588 start_codon:yes stop_codon:yes gene_type:complete